MNNSMNEDTSALAAVAAIGSYRHALPTYFTFKILSFSLLATTSMEKFKSNDFEAGGYKWRLVFYLKENKGGSSSSSSSGNHLHVFMFMKIVAGTDSLPPGWVVDASFRFSVLDQIRNKYSILGGTTRRFNEMNTMWGYDQLLPLTILNDSSSNGFLVDDACVFGAEVLPRKSTGAYGDCLTMVRSPSCVKFTWKIENFSRLKEAFIYSDVFYAEEEHKWKIQIYPKGSEYSREGNEYFSLYLCLLDDDSSINKKVYARFSYRVRDQLHNFHREVEDQLWFTSSLEAGWGHSEFMRLDELNDESKGFLVNDTCIIEVEVTVLGALKKLS